MQGFVGRHGRTLTIVIVTALSACLFATGGALFAVAGRHLTPKATSPRRPPAATARSIDASAENAPVQAASVAASISAAAPLVASATASTSAPEASTPRARADIAAYEGLGSWVDLYDSRAWKDPRAAVGDMAAHGVRTLYLETANFHAKNAVMNPSEVGSFIEAAHARGMKVVAWYLPNLKRGSVDYDRVMRAIQFKTPTGQGFDSFAMDIESSAVKSEDSRSRNLVELSQAVRAAVGPSYPLGAIIPSPVGMSKNKGYWNRFPYESVAGLYNVILPMGYYTYHVHGGAAAYAETKANMRILRSQPGCSRVPVHLIGGIAENSNAPEVRQFVRATRETGCIGASLYGWAGTRGSQWSELAAVAPRAPVE